MGALTKDAGADDPTPQRGVQPPTPAAQPDSLLTLLKVIYKMVFVDIHLLKAESCFFFYSMKLKIRVFLNIFLRTALIFMLRNIIFILNWFLQF